MGPIDDQGWNRVEFDGLLRIREELGAEISHVEVANSPASFERAFRDYARQGYSVVFGHGFEFRDAALAVAEDYPDTFFFISSSQVIAGNVIGLDTDSSQPFYLMGIVAASQNRRAGLIGGVEIPPISNALTGSVNGALSVDPNFPINITYLGSWTDVSSAKEAALSMIAAGIDFVVPHANAASSGAYQAIRESGPGISTFGVYRDYTDLAPDNVIGNYINDYGQGLVDIAHEVQSGTFETQSNIVFGLKNENVIRVNFLPDRVDSELLELIANTTREIAAGNIDTLARSD